MQVDLDHFRAQIEVQLRPDLPLCSERYQAFQAVDPFPEVPCALLHSGHLASYAIATGMIDPFDPARLTKPATYAVPLMGPCRYLDDQGRQHAFYLSNDPRARNEQFEVREKFELRRNSICYITLRPYFRMPAYVAGRFNLLIREVYRGLLVGTGPLVDPGFDGYLSIPIHNFTNNVYTFSAEENFVYFEFTKLSWSNPPTMPARPSWCPGIIHDQPPFPASKQRRRAIDDYLAEATGGLPAQSAIGEEIRKITETSDVTRRRLQIFSIAGVAGVAALIITALTLAFASYDVFSSARRFVDDVRLREDEANTQLQDRADEAATLVGRLEQSDADLIRQIDEIRLELRRQLASDEVMNDQISEMLSELSRLKAHLENFTQSGADDGDREPNGTE
jgi:deoxycytidine triphosphate deaminase